MCVLKTSGNVCINDMHTPTPPAAWSTGSRASPWRARGRASRPCPACCAAPACEGRQPVCVLACVCISTWNQQGAARGARALSSRLRRACGFHSKQGVHSNCKRCIKCGHGLGSAAGSSAPYVHMCASHEVLAPCVSPFYPAPPILLPCVLPSVTFAPQPQKPTWGSLTDMIYSMMRFSAGCCRSK